MSKLYKFDRPNTGGILIADKPFSPIGAIDTDGQFVASFVLKEYVDLFVASPDLLEACKAALAEHYERAAYTSGVADKLEAAIAKATLGYDPADQRRNR